MQMSSVIYDYCDGLYINMTNRCPTSCEFCIKRFTDSLGSADSLFLEREPSVEEVKKELSEWNLDNYEEVVFCGYGEPAMRLPEVLEVAEYIKEEYGKKVRMNTIGLSDLIWERKTAADLEGKIDSINVSLNTSDNKAYLELCHPVYGEESFDAVLEYIKEVKKYVPHVQISAVQNAIPKENYLKCKEIAAALGVEFKSR